MSYLTLLKGIKEKKITSEFFLKHFILLQKPDNCDWQLENRNACWLTSWRAIREQYATSLMYKRIQQTHYHLYETRQDGAGARWQCKNTSWVTNAKHLLNFSSKDKNTLKLDWTVFFIHCASCRAGKHKSISMLFQTSITLNIQLFSVRNM